MPEIMPEIMSEIMPEIIVEIDYDGYFERLTRQIVEQAQHNGHKFVFNKIIVNAGPWRSVACSVDKVDDNTVRLSYYAAIRRGFGQLTDDDLVGIGALL